MSAYEPSDEEREVLRRDTPVAVPPIRRRPEVVTESHRMLPSASDSEQALLSSFMIAPDQVGGLCVEEDVTHLDFHVPSHALIFSTLAGMRDSRRPIDPITLSQVLEDRGQLQECGGRAFISQLFTFLPTAANAAHYLDILKQKRTLRDIIAVCTEHERRSFDEQDNVCGVLEAAERKIFEIVGRAFGRRSKRSSTKEMVMDAITEIQDLYDRRGALGGLPTGIGPVDRLTDGLHCSDLILIASRPSMGKTALAMQICEHITVDLGKPVAVFSLEMSGRQLIRRQLCSRAKVNPVRVRDGYLSERDFPALTIAASQLAAAPIFIEEGSDMTIQVLRQRARALKAQHGICAIFVDSMSALRAQGKHDRHREVAIASNGLKECAKELGIPVVCIVHLGRAAEGERRPTLAHLRESGNLEQDADEIYALIREELMAKSDEDAIELSGKSIFRVLKTRMAEMNVEVPLTFLKEFTRFTERAQEDPNEDRNEKPKFAKYAGKRGKKNNEESLL